MLTSQLIIRSQKAIRYAPARELKNKWTVSLKRSKLFSLSGNNNGFLTAIESLFNAFFRKYWMENVCDFFNEVGNLSKCAIKNNAHRKVANL